MPVESSLGTETTPRRRGRPPKRTESIAETPLQAAPSETPLPAAKKTRKSGTLKALQRMADRLDLATIDEQVERLTQQIAGLRRARDLVSALRGETRPVRESPSIAPPRRPTEAAGPSRQVCRSIYRSLCCPPSTGRHPPAIHRRYSDRE